MLDQDSCLTFHCNVLKFFKAFLYLLSQNLCWRGRIGIAQLVVYVSSLLLVSQPWFCLISTLKKKWPWDFSGSLLKQGVCVWFLIRKLRSHMPCAKKTEATNSIKTLKTGYIKKSLKMKNKTDPIPISGEDESQSLAEDNPRPNLSGRRFYMPWS